jgi:hypothetical protein
MEFDALNREFPPGDGSGLIGRRAEAIVKIHFRRSDVHCSFPPCPPGADLQVNLAGAEPLSIEIKGTAARQLSWQQLKVSSSMSYKLICEGLPVYRVCGVFDQTPEIYVLRYGADFTLESEARWTFKPVRSTAPVSLRGDPALRPDRAVTAPASKYNALREYLASQVLNEVTLQFREAENVLGFALPSSAYKYQAFWANQSDTRNRPWARAWSDAGFDVDGYRLSQDGWVRFKRRRAEL